MRRLPLTRIRRALRRQARQFQEAFRQEAAHLIGRLFRRKPGFPGDPHAYVTAKNKPRLPHLSSAAVAELPEK